MRKSNFIVSIFVYLSFLSIVMLSNASSQTILLVPDASIKGAVLKSNKLYERTAKKMIEELEKNGYIVTQSTDAIKQFIPKNKRISTKDWKKVFIRKEVKEDMLMTLTITRYIERSPINQAQIGFSINLFVKKDSDNAVPLAFFRDMPKGRSWTVSPQCHGPCLNAFYAEKVKVPAEKLIRKVIRLLKIK